MLNLVQFDPFNHDPIKLHPMYDYYYEEHDNKLN